jgi:hypothetical protein
MRNCRALLTALFVLIAVVAFLLFVLLKPKKGIEVVAVVAADGESGVLARPGDTVVWTNLYPTDPGYTVHIDKRKPSPCTSGNFDFPVSSKADGRCTVSSSIGGSMVVPIYYTVAPGVSASVAQASKVKPFEVKGCPACPVMMGSIVGEEEARRKFLIGVAGFPTAAHISCVSKDVTPLSVDHGKPITWIEDDGQDWTVAINAPLPCDKSTYTSSAGDSNSSVCTVSANASGKYDYKATTTCNGSSTTYTGLLTVN